MQFYIGSHIVGILLKWCSSLGFVMVTINGYVLKKVLKDVYGMTLGDLRNSMVQRIKGFQHLIPKY